jgi:hypothetical protein
MTKIQQATLPAPRAYIIYAARSWAGGGQKSPITALILSKPALFKGLAKSVLTESGCPNVGRGRPDGSHGCPDAGDGRPNAQMAVMDGQMRVVDAQMWVVAGQCPSWPAFCRRKWVHARPDDRHGRDGALRRPHRRAQRQAMPSRTHENFPPAPPVPPSLRCPALPRLPPDSPPMPLANGGMRQRRHRSAMSLPTPSLSRFPGLVPGKSTTTTHHR